MAMKKVVIEGSTVTVGQCKDLFRMIGDGTIGFQEMERFIGVVTNSSLWVTTKQLQIFFKKLNYGEIDFEKMKSFLEHPKGTEVLTYPSYVRASKILGHDKVITVQTAYRLWGIPYSLEERHTLDSIKYSEATLRKCAAENRKGKASWYLIYIIGFTLPEQLKMIGTDVKSQPCFHLVWKDKDWFLAKKEKFWADKKPTNGDYYLINFEGYETNGVNYFDQLGKIGENPENEIINPHVLSESIISLIKDNKMSDGYKLSRYRSEIVNSGGEHVCIGYSYMYDGLEVTSAERNKRSIQLEIIVYKKHELE